MRRLPALAHYARTPSLTPPRTPRAPRLLYRSDRVYAEAAKCYLNALRVDPDNSQILTDLALLQVQLRDIQGFTSTRARMLSLKPGPRANWVALAVAHHLGGRLGLAASVLDQYVQLSGEPGLGDRYEHSEVLLYRAELLEEEGQPAWALAHLEACEKSVVDKAALLECRGRLQLTLGDLKGAEGTYRALLQRSSETHEYHAGLRCALGCAGPLHALSEESIGVLAREYGQLREAYPRSAAVRRLPLDFLRGAAFEEALGDYIAPFLRKGVPALGSDLAQLYDRGGAAGPTAWRRDALARVLAATELSLRTRAAFPGQPASSEQPGVHPWALLLLAQHHGAVGDTKQGLDACQLALQHTPTCVDFYLVKARLLTQAGRLSLAADTADEARAMDLADRYLNSVAVQALLAADRLDEAERCAALFARAGAGGGPAADGSANLVEMQCQWFTLGVGEVHLRAGRYGPALKRFCVVRKHFEDFGEDLFDFHGYCLRKMTLRAYVRLLRLLDEMPGHGYFRQAARGAVSAYLALHDAAQANASLGTQATGGADLEGCDDAALAAMPANERKKARAKARKAEQAAAAAAATVAAAAAALAGAGGKDGGGGGGAKSVVDPDPHGAALAATADPLGEAAKWVTALVRHADGHRETHVLAAQLYCRKGRPLLALRAALKLQALTDSGDCQEAHVAIVRVMRHLADALRGDALAAPVRTLLAEGLAMLLGTAADATRFNDARRDAVGEQAHAAAALLLA